MQKAIPHLFMRGGTSKELYFLKSEQQGYYFPARYIVENTIGNREQFGINS